MAEGEILGPNRTTGTPSLRGVLSRLTDVAWTFSHQIKRITDYVQGHAALSPSCAWLMGVSYAAQGAVDPKEALTPEVQEQLLQDFRSRVWCTYRRDFPSIGTEGLTGDVGWGCTIRSGQMMMAEVISRHVLGRNWRRNETLDLSYTSTDLLGLLSMFQDHPHAPLSIHQIIAAGRPHGMVPGKWLGPWVLCKSLAALTNSRPDLGLLVHVVCDPGGGAPCLDAHALLAMMTRQEKRTTQNTTTSTATTATATIIPNGLPDMALDDHQQPVSSAAAPHLDSDPVPSQAAEVEEAQQALTPLAISEPDANRHVDTGAKVDASLSSLPTAKGTIEPSQKLIQGVVGNGNAVELRMHEAQGNGDMHVVDEPVVASHGEFTEQQSAGVSQEPVGIGTGCDQVGVDQDHQQVEVQEPVAAFTRQQPHPPQHHQPQPQAQMAQQEPPPGLLLLLPLTLGVGRVNQLYYPQLLQVLTFPQSIGIVGGRPSASLFFIGHQDLNLMYLDPHIPQQAAVLPAALPTYFCDAVRLMPITNIDPSLAIGFYCRDAGELQDLVTRLDQLAVEHRRAPLVTVTDIATGSANRQSASVPDRQDSQRSGSWEVPHRNGDMFTVQQTRSRQKQKHDEEGEDLESWEVL